MDMDNDSRLSSVEQGVYAVWLYLPEPKTIQVGALGLFFFAAGVYVYCGSAQRHLQARLRRHRQGTEKRHWHIDYFRTEARLLGTVAVPGPKQGECFLTDMYLEIPGAYAPIRGFGSSDCSCRSHFVYLPGAVPVAQGGRYYDSRCAERSDGGGETLCIGPVPFSHSQRWAAALFRG